MRLRRSLVLLATTAALTWGLTTATAQTPIPNYAYLRDSSGQVWTSYNNQRVAIPIYPATDEEIAAIPWSGLWMGLKEDGTGYQPGPKPEWAVPNPSAAAVAPPPPPAAPAAPATTVGATFGTGTKVVGVDIQPGTYRSNNSGSGCYWARLKALGGVTGDILANDNAIGPAVVTIQPGDAGFTSSRCADWIAVSGPVTASPDAPFGDGTWVVGIDIAPGLWRSDAGSGCYWERAREFGGGTGSIIANENARGSAVVQIAPGDKAFKSSRCGTWTKAG